MTACFKCVAYLNSRDVGEKNDHSNNKKTIPLNPPILPLALCCYTFKTSFIMFVHLTFLSTRL